MFLVAQSLSPQRHAHPERARVDVSGSKSPASSLLAGWEKSKQIGAMAAEPSLVCGYQAWIFRSSEDLCDALWMTVDKGLGSKHGQTVTGSRH